MSYVILISHRWAHIQQPFSVAAGLYDQYEVFGTVGEFLEWAYKENVHRDNYLIFGEACDKDTLYRCPIHFQFRKLPMDVHDRDMHLRDWVSHNIKDAIKQGVLR